MWMPAVALLWQTWARYPRALAALVLGFVAVIGFQRTLSPDVLVSEKGVLLTVLPLGLFFACAGFIFSHAEIGSRVKNSSFPGWMFTLPVRTSQLVAFPMLAGAAAMAVMWAVAAKLVFRPVGLDVPVWWPALCLAATLAWLQAIDWSPLGLLNKAVLAVVVLAGVWGISFAVVEKYHVEDWRALPLLLFLPAAYAAAWAGVSRARHGASEGRPGWQALLEAVGSRLPERRMAFASPARAQLWFEWRRCGVLVPAVLGGWMVFLAALTPLVGGDTFGGGCLMTSLYLIPVFSPLVGCVLGKPEVWSRQFRMSAYAAGRPLTSGTLAAARMLAAASGLWCGWALLAAGAALAFTVRGEWSLAGGMWRSMTRVTDPQYAALMGPLFLVSLIGVTTLQLAGHLCVGLSGRLWVLAATVVFYMVGVPNVLLTQGPLWGRFNGNEQASLILLRLIVGGAIAVKFLASAGVVGILLRRRLAGAGFVAAVVACWLVTAGSFLNYLVFRAGGAGDVWSFASVAVLACPLTRLLLAPPAVEWNRRR